ncbi:MAG TPA: M4 family metallopeptidase [Pyrinomonadaceae bacterium]
MKKIVCLSVFVISLVSMLQHPNVLSQGNPQSPEQIGKPCGADPACDPNSPKQGTFKAPINTDGKPKGWVVKFYHKKHHQKRESWVDEAHGRGLTHIKKHAKEFDLVDPHAELELLSVERDDLGITNVLFEQVYKGVPVYGGKLAIRFDANGELLTYPAEEGERRGIDGQIQKGKERKGIDGKIYATAKHVDTKPRLDSAQAITAAKSALSYTGPFSKSPEAELFILPRQVGNSGPADLSGGATLVYKVELLIEDGVRTPERHWYFVDAHDGSVVWHFDAMGQGAGQSWYSGYVWIPTGWFAWNNTGPHCGLTQWNNGFWLWDGSGYRGNMETLDLKNTQPAYNFYYYSMMRFDGVDDRWGMPTEYGAWPAPDCNWQRQQAGVDTQYGMALAWDYFLDTHGRRGIDNAGFRMFSRIHYGNNFDWAAWNGYNLTFGDGSSGRPWVSIDAVAHEWTHGINEKTANLHLGGESGASAESFSDIFGTMIEFYASNWVNPPDWLVGEDFFPGGKRDMYNPPSKGHPDHFNNRVYPGHCWPESANDNCGVHSNSGIQNKAFFLLAVGGTHPYSGISVPGVGNDVAARVFYRALTSHLLAKPYARLYQVRNATYNAAVELYGYHSTVGDKVEEAWRAVGVPSNPIYESWYFVEQHYKDFLNQSPDPGGWDYWANQINRNCHPNDQGCIEWRRVMVSRAFWESGAFRERAEVKNSGLLNPPGSARPYDNRQFVRWCYKMYLNREPDQGGWDFWTNDLNGHGDYNITINAFLRSGDYHYRYAFL